MPQLLKLLRRQQKQQRRSINMWKSKTVYAGLAGIVSSFGLYMSSELSLAELLQVAVPSLLAIFLRAGVQKSTDAAQLAVEAASSVTPAPKKKAAKKAN